MKISALDTMESEVTTRCPVCGDVFHESVFKDHYRLTHKRSPQRGRYKREPRLGETIFKDKTVKRFDR